MVNINLIEIQKAKDKLTVKISWQAVFILAAFVLAVGGWLSPTSLAELLKAWRQ